MLSSRRIAAPLIAIGVLAVAAPVAGASATPAPADQSPFFGHLQAAGNDFATSITAYQSGVMHLGDAWASLVTPRPYHMLAS